MSIYIYSTLSADQLYALADGRNIKINGGANVADKRLVTPKGKVTRIEENDFELLQQNIIFQAHAKNGFVTADHGQSDPERFAEKNLEAADKGAQDTAATVQKRNPKAAAPKAE
ncbi:hypothetical protein vBBaMIFTN2_09 [Bordetella phage vB_BaM-IFTN2]|uniref:hypothetical protein n=2 Tax=Bordetella avium TaxID=521 RepID=UPI000E0C8BCD|nr:hypothetical protein [Bordetella avium]UOK17011.1 hypothetical protein vBBaMIFTN1_09 [Bordetella phage vB_BaM-IFTN1]UOK17075.1 hypothetical protein vBBaMIFTN2_09 [Bordetella phage vB_BaM-IFTN2]UOK17138.1 hypothetical protein vBBaMIFTN3_09 [Bordetella phage vB_BaM-IFTN3]UOK17201.1 hypothetical protein vBBaMIFTN4_09 [Bordetella phage vB_BaM-IFTN4]UOK17273.1 hypothetical protein vBBaMIFTN5_09 [Bordetella phage vB_BaM-IFTN5]UOK17342.1 hypothetical protein vBBaMIFTN6_09 [Bordetella phage vB_BaM